MSYSGPYHTGSTEIHGFIPLSAMNLQDSWMGSNGGERKWGQTFCSLLKEHVHQQQSVLNYFMHLVFCNIKWQ